MKIEKLLYENPSFLRSFINSYPFYWGMRLFIKNKFNNDKVTQVSYLYALDLLKYFYSSKTKKVMINIFTPSEIFYALDIYPLLPEVASGFLSALNLLKKALYESEEILINSDICSVHRGVIGLSKLNIFPKIDFLIVYTRPCFSPIYSFSFIKELCGGELYVIESFDDINFLSSAFERLFYDLCKKLNIEDGDIRLKKALKLSNVAYEYFQEIRELRKNYVVMDGKFFLDYAGMIFSAFGSKYGVEFFRTLRDEMKNRIKKGRIIEPKIRLYWMHLGPYFPTDIFHWLNEKGAYIVFEESSAISWDKFDINSPFESLARKLLNLKAFSSIDERFSLALKNVEEYKVDGIVIFNQWGCRQGAVPSYILRQKFIREGISSIVIDGDLVDGQNFPKEQIKTRLEAFLEVIS